MPCDEGEACAVGTDSNGGSAFLLSLMVRIIHRTFWEKTSDWIINKIISRQMLRMCTSLCG